MNGINLLSILVASIASMAVGFLWFSPALFGTKWMKDAGMYPNPDKIAGKKEMRRGMIIGFAGSILSAIILNWIAKKISSPNIMETMNVVFMIWLGFTLPQALNVVAWEKRSWSFFAIVAFGALAMLFTSAIVIFLFR